MTHDELLTRINIPLDEGYQYVDIMYMKALRAVVELHKPEPYKNIHRCTGCGTNNKLVVVSKSYPCPIIQAIEKELE